MNVTEVRDSDFKNVFPGFFNFTVGILVRILVSLSGDLFENKPLKLAKVDATEAAELAQKYDVTGYPTIKMFRKGSVFDYNGGRERHSIVSYLTEQAGPPSTEITTKKAFDNILKKA